MTINPELHPFLDRWDQEWSTLPEGSDAAGRRAHFEIVAANMKLPKPENVNDEAVHWIEGTTEPVRVRIYRHTSGGVQPALIYLHGGGWMQGSPETHADITARIASLNAQTVISVDYALAPENPFPMALDQVNDVMRWAFANAADLGIDPTRISIGGDSAGGNIAAASCLDLRGELDIRAQLLIYPACDFDLSRPSYAENPEGPIVKPSDAIKSIYCPDAAFHETYRFAPLLAETHANLPTTYIAVGEHDPLRDSGVAYAEALLAAGVPVVLDRGPGLIHGYLRAMEYCTATVESLKTMSAWLAEQNAK